MTKAILLDIEGTSTPIDFVHKTLFPFAKDRMGDFVAANMHRLDSLLVALQGEHARENDPADLLRDQSPDEITAYLKYLIDIDRKSTPLKAIQGEIWRQGYEAGLLRSEIYDDVPRAFRRWRAADKTIAIYSSGSVLAQELLFRYTSKGDLTGYISDHFDTNFGGKREASSYTRICESLGLAPSEITFISDIPAELSAASEAGLSPLLSIRPGNAPVENAEEWNSVTSFDQID